MSRVPVDTVLLRFALAAALALPLAGCGGNDDAGQASTPPASSTPAVATSPTAGTSTTPPAPTPSTPSTKPSPGADGEAKLDPNPPAEDPPAVSDTPDSASDASPKKASPDEIASDMKKVHAALKAAGIDPGDPVIGDAKAESAALSIDGGQATIVFFESPRRAARQATMIAEQLKGTPQYITIDRKANRLFLLALPAKPTDEQLARFRKIRQIANGAV